MLTVDEHPVVLTGLRRLPGADPRFALCGEAASPADACTRAAALRPELIVTDLVLSGADGLALIDALRARLPATRIVVYSSHDEMLWARHVLAAGARGYVSKAEPLEAVAVALEAVSRGEIHVSDAVQRLLRKADKAAPHDLSQLSARELQILALIGRGCSSAVRFTVEDRGPGVDPALHATLFGKFRRGAEATGGPGGDARAGTGMGLFIAATYAARIGATLSYRPRDGGGAVFELALPLTPN